MSTQKRLLFKLPLDKPCTILPDPVVPSVSILVLTASFDLHYAQLAGRQLRFVRNNVANVLWITTKRFLVLDSSTHDLVVYKIDQTDGPLQFVSTIHFAFQYFASVLLEYGLGLAHSDPLELLKFSDNGELDLLAKREFFLRVFVDSKTRNFHVISCLKLGKSSIATSTQEMSAVFTPGLSKLFLVSTVENEFLVCLPMKQYSLPKNARLLGTSPDFRWAVLVTPKLDMYQIFLPVFQSSAWSCLHKAVLYTAQGSRFQEDEVAADNRKSIVTTLRRVNNAVWEREASEVPAKNHAMLNFAQNGWIFPAGGTRSELGSPVTSWSAPVEFVGFEPVVLHCTESEAYVSARNSEGKVLLGVKRFDQSDSIWMTFSQDCLVAFPTTTSYPINLFYPMSMAVIASNHQLGFQKDVAEAAAPDPWEDLTENQVMELAISQDIVDKAVDYLQKRFPDRLDLLEPDYNLHAARSIAREYLLLKNIPSAEEILNFVHLDINVEMRKLFLDIKDPDFRRWLLQIVMSREILLETDQQLFEYLEILEAHSPETLSIAEVAAWSEELRQENLLKAGILTKDPVLVDSFAVEFLWDFLRDSEDELRLVDWIHGNADFTKRPVDPSFRERKTSAADFSAVDEVIANEFAKVNVFSAEELGSWKQYVLRLISAFGTDHVFFDANNPDRLSGLPENLQTQFVDFCIEMKLLPIVLELADQVTFERILETHESGMPEWLSLLMQFRTTNFDRVEELKAMSLQNARFCYGNDVTVEKLLCLEETELALTLLCLSQDIWPANMSLFDGSDSVTVLDLLQKQLSKFPKLKEALFPLRILPEERIAKSVTAYRLLQANAPYDPRKLFGWQSTNSTNTHYRAVEMPAFSNTELQEKYGYKKELDYSYYLKNARPSFAYWSFVSSLTADNFKDELMAGRDMAFFLAVFFFNEVPIVAACVSFLEMLGIESMSTRINVQAARLVWKHQKKVTESSDCTGLIRDLFIELYKYGSEVAGGLIEDVVSATSASVACSGVYPASWDVSSQWVLVNQFAELYNLPLSTEYLRLCAENNEWLNFLAFCDLFQYPLSLVTPVLESFRHPHIRENMRLILQSVKSAKHDRARPGEPVENHNRNIRSTLYSRIGVLASDKTTSASTTSDEEQRAKESYVRKTSEIRPANLVEVLTSVQKALHPWRELLEYATEFHCPLYAMMAANEPGMNKIACLCTILFTSLPEKDLMRYRTAENVMGEIHWTRYHVQTLVEFQEDRQELRLAAVAVALVVSGSIVAQLIEIAADVEEREDRTVVAPKLKRLTETLQRARQEVKTPKKVTDDDLDCAKWGMEFGLKIYARLMSRLKIANEMEWRRGLQLLKDSAVIRYREAPSSSEDVDILVENVDALSQSVQFDASRLLELKSLLRDFQRSSLWSTEAFRMDVWRSIFSSVRVELSEKQSTGEILEILQQALKSSDSLIERCVLLTIMWKLDDTDKRFRKAWVAKISYGLTASTAFEEWITDSLIGAGTPHSDLQRELLLLGALPLAEFVPVTNGCYGDEGECSCQNVEGVKNCACHGGGRKALLDNVIAFLLKQGNLSLAARLSTVFGFLHADLDAICSALALAKGATTIAEVPKWILQQVQKPVRKLSTVASLPRKLSHSLAASLPNGHEEVEYGDEVVTCLNSIVEVCSLGRDVVLAIMDNYCFSKLLQVEFEATLRSSTTEVLERLFAVTSLESLALARRCLISFKANTLEVTAFISGYVRELLRQGLEDPQCDVRALGESAKPFLAVAIDLNSLGHSLVEAATKDSLAVRLNVELLIAAHEVFSKAGNLDGVTSLLSACKSVAKSVADSGDYHSLLRLLNGVGRYSELTFIFHLIKEADKMELLFSRGVEKDPKLKNAILNYLRKFHSDDADTFEMLAAAYSMHREIGETFLGIAQDRLALFKHRSVVDTMETQQELKRITQYLMDAAGNFSRAECYSRTERCIEQARLVALQIVFLPSGLRLLSLNNPAGFVATHPRFAESYIYAQAYGIKDEWTDGIYQNYVINGDIRYLQDFKIKFKVTAALVLDVAKKFRVDNSRPPTAPIYMKKLLRDCMTDDIEVAYKLANDLDLNDLSMEFLQIDGGAFLRDVMKF